MQIFCKISSISRQSEIQYSDIQINTKRVSSSISPKNLWKFVQTIYFEGKTGFMNHVR